LRSAQPMDKYSQRPTGVSIWSEEARVTHRRSRMIGLLGAVGVAAGLLLAVPSAQATPAAVPSAAQLTAIAGGFDRVPGTAWYVDAAARGSSTWPGR
jgi:hypothetical protein